MSDNDAIRGLTEPEQRVLAAVRAHETCDFTGEASWDSLSMAEQAKLTLERIEKGPQEVPWSDRRIGADFLRLLLLNQYPEVDANWRCR